MHKLKKWLSKFNCNLFLTILVAITMGVYFASTLPHHEKPAEIVHDTIYVQQPLPDSILDRIANDVSEINKKLTPKKVYIRKRPKTSDTIRINASIKLDK